MKYKLELVSEPRNGQQWFVRGLKQDQRIYGDEATADTAIHPGMYESCDCADSVIAGLHEQLYGLLQTNPDLRNGDEFVSEACTANMHHHYDDSMGTFQIPALRFVCEGIHVNNRSDTTSA